MDIKKIIDFCKTAAPANALNAFPTPEIPDALSQTNTDFLIRLTLDGRHKLRNLDPLTTRINFTDDDITNLSAGCYAMAQLIVEEFITLSPENEYVLKNALPSAGRLATYYSDELAVIAAKKKDIEDKGDRLYAEFKRACHAKDYAALAKMYPRHDLSLDIERRPDTENLERGIPSIPQRLYEIEKTNAMKRLLENVSFLTPQFVATAMRARPQEMEECASALFYLERNHDRNSAIHAGFHAFLSDFEDVLSEAPAPTLTLFKHKVPSR